MKKSEFKEMIKESVKEVLVEEGVLKSVISEVVKAVKETDSGPTSMEDVHEFIREKKSEKQNHIAEQQKNKLAETRKKMLDAIGKDSFGGIDIFEGTTPLPKGGNTNSQPSPSSALEGVDPNDSGVDISNMLGNANVWKQLLK